MIGLLHSRLHVPVEPSVFREGTSQILELTDLFQFCPFYIYVEVAWSSTDFHDIDLVISDLHAILFTYEVQADGVFLKLFFRVMSKFLVISKL